MKYLIIIISIFSLLSCNTNKNITKSQSVEKDTIYSNINGKGINIIFDVEVGKEHNYPSFVFWTEDVNGNYIQTLFTTKSVATGIFGHGSAGDGKWKNEAGEAIRPASLPYWMHKRGIENNGTYVPLNETSIPDAYTGATPKADFELIAKTDSKPDNKFVILFEVNQPWDWNEYWTNDKFSNNSIYKTSCQPSIIYAVTVDLNSDVKEYYLNPIGHGHYAGEDGNLYTDLSTITTAFEITKKIKIIIND